MILVREWRRQLFGGMGAALLVPAALLVALALLTAAGGLAGLGALGQAFSGPALPSAPTRGPISVTRASRTIPPSVLSALVTGPGGTPRAAGAPAAHRPTAGQLPPTSTQPPGPGPARSTGSPPTSSSPSPSTSSTGAPSPPPTLTDEVVSTATSATSQLPSPVGAAVTATIQSAGSAVDHVAPIPAPGPPQLP